MTGLVSYNSCRDQGEDFNSIVDKIPQDKLDWAMKQVQKTIKKEEEVWKMIMM